MMQLGAPWALWALVLVPLLLGAVWALARRGRARALDAYLGRRAGAVRLAVLHASGSRLAVVVGAVALCVALLDLQVRAGSRTVQQRGSDLAVVVDVSDSMLVADVEATGTTTRLEQARRELVDLLRLAQQDRVALVAFAGSAHVQAPLTLDHAAVRLFAEELAPGIVSQKGSNVGEALRVALEVFDRGAAHDSASQAVVLISDGEDHDGEALEAAELAKARGVRVFVMGVGTSNGGPIPSSDGGFRRDERGSPILSRMDEATLGEIARTTGGVYVHSSGGDADTRELYARGVALRVASRDQDARVAALYLHLFPYFVAVALLALLLEPWLDRRASGVAS